MLQRLIHCLSHQKPMAFATESLAFAAEVNGFPAETPCFPPGTAN
jgi:hypothetical protein